MGAEAERIWRWEQQLYKVLGPEWHRYAQDRQEWQQLVDQLVSWRVSPAWTSHSLSASLLPSLFLLHAASRWRWFG